MNKQKLISYIQLINTNSIGPVNFKKIVSHYGSVDRALQELSKTKEIFSKAKAEEELMISELKHVKILTIDDEDYPYNLKQIESAPPIIYALGNVELLKNDNMLAVVGARNASLSACRLAKDLSADIAKHGINIVSGMARGIDGAAHEGALSVQGGTIAVLGTGIDVIYPKENTKIYESLIENGLILSEYPFHTRPQASNFPRRNRIVSGLSKGVLVIEAGLQSGSLITAHQALEQGRDVYAVPGAPYDGRSAGCNQLLKEGAFVVESANDVLENFNFTQAEFVLHKRKEPAVLDLFEYSLDNQKNNSDISKQNNEHEKLLSLISEGGNEIDEVIHHIDLPAEDVLTMIMELELDGKLIRLPGNKIAKG